MKAGISVARTALVSAAPVAESGYRRPPRALVMRRRILDAAARVFAEDGFAGWRVKKIARLADAADHTVYYYFGNKEKLFTGVIEYTCQQFNNALRRLDLDARDPLAAMVRLIEFSWDYHRGHPELACVLGAENLLRGKHAKKSRQLKKIGDDALAPLGPLLAEGRRRGLFRGDLEARDVYLTIAALAYFCSAQRYTLNALLGEDLAAPDFRDAWLGRMTDTVLRQLLCDPGLLQPRDHCAWPRAAGCAL